MTTAPNIWLFMIGCILSSNLIFSRFLGICPFLGVSGKLNTAFGMSAAVTFVITLSSAFTWSVNHFVLERLGLSYLNTICFIIIIAGLVQLVEMFIKKSSPSLYKSLGIYLPLITTNCAVLGISLLNIQNGYNFLYAILNGLFSSLGFMLAMMLMAGVRTRLETSKVPKCMRGFPISLVIAGLMSIAFMGFNGLGG